MSSDYWIECVAEALDEAGLRATLEQINAVADAVQGAHEMYGEAHGYHHIPNPLVQEIDELKRKLKREEEKTVCKTCRGTGREVVNFGTMQSVSSCPTCHGEGKV